MVDIVSAVTYDWIPENLKAIQSLRTKRAVELMHESNLTRSRAMHAASDEIARDVMRPPKTGQELDTWIGVQQHKQIIRAEQATQTTTTSPMESNANGRVHFNVPEGLTPPMAVRRGMSEAIWGEAFKFVSNMPRDVWKPLEFDDPNTVSRASSSLATHAKRVDKSLEHGWKLTTKRDKNHPCVLWVMKMTLK